MNTPNNPTGRMFDEDELSLLAELCERWNATVISDEVYAAFAFDRPHLSVADVPSLRDRAIVIGSLSKSHAVSGWRIGYLRANAAMTDVLRRMHIAATGFAVSPLQQAVVSTGLLDRAAWDPAPELKGLRDRAVTMLTEAGLTCTAPEGGCYVLAGIRTVTELGSHRFAEQLLERRKVLVVPGTAFYGDAGHGDRFVRVAFNRQPHTLDEAAARLTREQVPVRVDSTPST